MRDPPSSDGIGTLPRRRPEINDFRIKYDRPGWHACQRIFQSKRVFCERDGLLPRSRKLHAVPGTGLVNGAQVSA